MNADELALERLEENALDAEIALEALKAQWAIEDTVREKAREALLEAHAQGARDCDAERRRLRGEVPA